MLKKIQIAKKLFIINIEEGSEALIPKELSQKCMPQSFRYYDATIKIVQDMISDELKDRLKIKI